MAVFLAVSLLRPGILHQEYMSNWDMHNGRLWEKSGGTEALLGEGDKEKERMLVYSVQRESQDGHLYDSMRRPSSQFQCGQGNELFHCQHSVSTYRWPSNKLWSHMSRKKLFS